MSHHLEEITFGLEKHCIPFEKWEVILKNFPDCIQKEARYIIRWSKGEEKDMPQSIGLGFRRDIGWFALGAGQGPFIIWSEKEIPKK